MNAKQQPLLESQHRVEQLFTALDESSTYIAQQFEKDYLEALIDMTDSLVEQELVIEATKEQTDRLRSIIDFRIPDLSKEELRRVFQLLLLKGMKEKTIPGTGLTPDTVSMFTGYLAQKLIQPHTVLDLGVGSGNLLTCVLNQYEHALSSYGIEVDPLLIRLAYVNAGLQEHPVELYRQDALMTLQMPAADLIVSDLPVGIYPNEKTAKTYAVHVEGEESYTHQLLIEKAIRISTEGGYMVFIIPNTLFTEPRADRLRKYINEQTYIQAVLQLPQDLFQEGSIHKSMFVLQKKGEGVRRPSETLMAHLPPFTEQNKFRNVLAQIEQWIQTNKR